MSQTHNMLSKMSEKFYSQNILNPHISNSGLLFSIEMKAEFQDFIKQKPIKNTVIKWTQHGDSPDISVVRTQYSLPWTQVQSLVRKLRNVTSCERPKNKNFTQCVHQNLQMNWALKSY